MEPDRTGPREVSPFIKNRFGVGQSREPKHEVVLNTQPTDTVKQEVPKEESVTEPAESVELESPQSVNQPVTPTASMVPTPPVPPPTYPQIQLPDKPDPLQ